MLKCGEIDVLNVLIIRPILACDAVLPLIRPEIGKYVCDHEAAFNRTAYILSKKGMKEPVHENAVNSMKKACEEGLVTKATN